MLKYFSKFFMDILPSVVATVVGAYIVNHYIVPKSGSDTPKAAVTSPATPTTNDQATANAKPEAVQDTLSKQDTPSKPDDKATAEKRDAVEKKEAEKPAETVKASTEPKRPVAREKAVAKAAQPPAQAATTETDDHRDATELARTVIERLRAAPAETASRPAEAAPRVQETARTETARTAQEPTRVEAAAVAPVPPPTALQPLPPAVNVMGPGGERSVGFASQGGPSSDQGLRSAQARLRPRADGDRLIPPADIPEAARQIDEAAAAPVQQKPSVADDMLSAARSVFHAVVPQ